jgi:hypothetical protein
MIFLCFSIVPHLNGVGGLLWVKGQGSAMLSGCSDQGL